MSDREQAIKDVEEAVSQCIGYPGCDGDLIGEEHDPMCPAYNKPEPSLQGYAVSQRERVIALERALREAARRLDGKSMSRATIARLIRLELGDR